MHLKRLEGLVAKDNFRMDLEGFDDLHRRLEVFEVDVRGKIARTPLRNAMRPVLDAARANAEASEETGGLKETIKLTVSASYSRVKKSGRRAFAFASVSMGRTRVVDGKTGHQALQIEFPTENTEEQPVLKPALRDNAKTVLAILGKDLSRSIKLWEKKIARKTGRQIK